MGDRDLDASVRLRAFEFLEEQTRLLGAVLPRDLLAHGFMFESTRVPLMGPQGIFKPAVLPQIPLTITTVPEVEGRPRPYEDDFGDNGLLSYRYRGGERDREHRDNAGLRLAMSSMTPLVYLLGVVPGQYRPIWPVYIVGDNPDSLTFAVDLRVALGRMPDSEFASRPEVELQRQYALTQVKRRLHQEVFRVRVLRAYEERCAICRLRHQELLEAAHILPDGHPKGDPIVPNGIALCRLHHGAFDNNLLGITPDLVVELRSDVLHEADGPMLKYGLQEFQNHVISVPKRDYLQPKREFLEERYDGFKKAG